MPSDDFPDRLRDARKAAGLTQIELADRVGVHQTRLSQIEGGAAVDLEMRWRLAVALGVDPASLDERLASTKRGRR
jgi:transcriptional regulator with XRE-family HTH domain